MAANLLGLAKSMAQLKRVPSQAVKPIAQRLNAIIQDNFDAGQDPYGNPWAPLAARTLAKGRTPPPLTDTRALRGSVVLTPMAGAGLQLGDPPPYGPVHMAGRPEQNLPKRRYFPDAGLPAAWLAVIAEEIDAKVKENLQ